MGLPNGDHVEPIDFSGLEQALLASSTKQRRAGLSTINQKLVDPEKSTELLQGLANNIIDLLFRTYPYYTDRTSRKAVQECLQADCLYPPHTSRLVDIYQNETSKPGLAPTNAFVLVEWGSIMIQHAAQKGNEAFQEYGSKVVQAHAQALELVLSSTLHAKESVHRSAVVVTRRALRKLLRAIGDPALSLIIGILTAKGQPLGIKSACFLGVLAGVCSCLPDEIAPLAKHKQEYYAFYLREILGSRTPVPKHLASALNGFFGEYSTAEELRIDVVPPLEKALLRAPEVVLNDLISPFFGSISQGIDAAPVLADNLAKPLLSNLKSSNSSVRNGAISAFGILISRSQDQEALGRVVDEVLLPMSTPKLTADHRALHARILAMIPAVPAKAKIICEILCTIITKEANENAVGSEIAALLCQFRQLPGDTSAVVKTVVSTCTKGLEDKRPGIRRQWMLGVGHILWVYRDGGAQESSNIARLGKLEADCIPCFLKVTEEVVSNPVTAVSSGLAVGPLITISLCQVLLHSESESIKAAIRKAKLMDKVLAISPKTATLLNPRIYTRLSEPDYPWQIRALMASSAELRNHSESDMALAWSQAIIYFIAANGKSKTREMAMAALTKAYLENQVEIAKVVINGLWTWYRNVETDEKDTAATISRMGTRLLHFVIRSICHPSSHGKPADESSATAMQVQLIDMLVLCRPEILPHVHWIEMCLRVGEDPGLIAKINAEECLAKVEQCLSSRDGNPALANIRLAAYNTAAELAFVSPDTIIPLLLEKISQDLPRCEVVSCGPTETAIARTPEGTAFIDVLSTQNQKYVADKNSKDYDTVRWEEEMRSQIAKKKGQEKKLTADEKAKVNAQLVKEAGIRQEVRRLEQKLENGIGYIHALAVGPPTEAVMWLSPSLHALTAVIEAGAAHLVGDAADEAYLACSNFVSSRLGSLRRFVGVATVRLLGSHLPPHLEQEPLKDLVTRVLYRMHFLGEQRPFDEVSLLYMLPLMAVLVRQGGVPSSSEEEADEQMTLVLEFLSFHADKFSNTNLPRSEFLTILIDAMQKDPQHFKLLKDLFADFCRTIGPTISATIELPILLKGVVVASSSVRANVLQAIRDDIDLTDYDFCEEIWLASHDVNEENATLGALIWQENALEAEPADAMKMLPYLTAKDRQIRRAAAKGLAGCIGKDHATFASILNTLQDQYRELTKPRNPELDAYGMPKKTDLRDPWEARSGIALAFQEMASIFDVSMLVPFVGFLINDSALSDRSDAVRDEMITSATATIEIHGASHLEELMQMLKSALDESGKNPNASDLVGEAVVVLYGALGRHLPDGDERVPQVVHRLLLTLSTPSETVQYAVANCLPPLIRTSSKKTSEYVQTVMDQLLNSKKFAARRGGGYGLAGIVKGKGISALREYRVMSSLKAATENKKDQNHRQAALFAYELLAMILGPIFEPYIIQIVPQLLSSFGDATADVREACLDASKACFAHLSSYGVKIVLPTLLEGLDEPQWRSKKGACDLLGAMAYLDPQQLAVSLPDIIPPLTNVLNDSHKEVRAAANRSLQRFGEVISNPEVKSLVGILLKALSDPTKYTDHALDSLIKVSFVHYLDSPSLALIVRILQRGLDDRSATKRKSSQIIGSLAHLTERKDVTPHLPILVAGLKMAIVDPVPATRATASKALGSLVEKLGEDALPDLIPSLMSTLKSDSGAGDRLGSAQALSEVLAGLGTARLEETLPTILQNVASTKPTVREGFMSLFIYLPACFGNSFANYLSKIIPSILSGLADEIESIRETSLKAGRLLVKNFATKAIDLLLPELDRGLSNDSYRIRLSSVELVGDLLFNLTGISGKMEQDEGEEDGAAEAGQSLLEVLGEVKRNKILSSLYICRYDTSGLVRSAAINVWKALVATPRTLKELVPTLTQLLIRRLASSNPEQKLIAGNALGEFVRKAGDGVLATLLPTLEDGLQTSTDRDNKQGICIALREIISSASPETLEDYEKTLISVVRVALVDPDNEVRETAAEAFDSLQRILGKRAVDQVLPPLLNLLRTEGEAHTALSALLTLLTDNTRSNIILPNLVPTLLVSPISSFNAKAIASLSQVAGSAMTRRLPAILNALMDNIIVCKDDGLRSELEDSFDAILLSVDEFDGLNTAMNIMLGLVKNDDHRKRAAADVRLSNFFANADVDYSRYHQDLIRVLLISFDDSDADTVRAAWLALSELTKKLKKEEMESLVLSSRQQLQHVGVPGANLPGFMLPKGINAILPIFLQGLMNGSAEQRTNAALAISEIIDRSSADSLKPFVTQITGPLIRVVSERSADVKSAIMLTLNNLLEKIPTLLKPFLPQLQRTFAKSLADESSEILRSRAAKALGTLITLTPRVDPLITELVTGSKATNAGVQNAMLRALYEVVSKAGSNMSESSRNLILSLIDGDASGADEKMAITHAQLLGALVKSLPPTFNTSSLLKTRVLTTHMTNSSVLSLNSVLRDSPASLTEGFAQETPALICHGIKSKQTFISDNCVLAAGKYLLIDDKNPRRTEASASIIEALANAVQPGGPSDTRRLALVVIRTVNRTHNDLIIPHLNVLVPPIFASVRDIVLPVKLAAEAAFVELFSVVEKENQVFDRYAAEEGPSMNASTKRSMQEYFKRVAVRLGAQAREKREAEGGQGGLGLSSDEREDEREIWSVGKVDLGEGTFGI